MIRSSSESSSRSSRRSSSESSSRSSNENNSEKIAKMRREKKKKIIKKGDNISKIIALIPNFEKLDKDTAEIVIEQLKKMALNKPAEKEEMTGYILATKVLEKYKAKNLGKKYVNRFKGMTHEQLYSEYKKNIQDAKKEAQIEKERQERVRIEREESNRKYREERNKEREEQKARLAMIRSNSKSSSSSSGKRKSPHPSYHR